MKTPKFALLTLFTSIAFAASLGAQDNPFQFESEEARDAIIADGAEVKKVADGFVFTEGPLWLPWDDAVIFSDIPADTIYKWSPEYGEITVWRSPSHNANGHALDNEGRIMSCEHGTRRISRTDEEYNYEVLIGSYRDKRLNRPNDVVVRKDGTIWFTDPDYGHNPEAGTKELSRNYVFRFDPETEKLTIAAQGFAKPNGLAFSPDHAYLYVADADGQRHQIKRYRVNADLTLGQEIIFANIRPGSPDGIRVDAEGRVFSSAGNGVQIFAPNGEKLGTILVPQTPSNLCFGGEDYKTLYITARSGFYSVPLKVAGAEAVEVNSD